MRRTLATFEWNAQEWETFASTSFIDPVVDANTMAGITVYAYKRAAVQRRMIGVFINDWYHNLKDKSLGSSWLKKYPAPPKNKQ